MTQERSREVNRIQKVLEGANIKLGDVATDVMYHRIAARRGKNKANIAVAHAILVTIYHMLKEGSSYHDLGTNHYDKINKEAIS